MAGIDWLRGNTNLCCEGPPWTGPGTPWGCFTNSDGLSDRATDHRPMLFVHNRMVRPQSDSLSLLVKQLPGLTVL